MNLSLEGKAGLVTGASVGIGRAIARALAAEGVRVAVVARRRNLLEELCDEILGEGLSEPVIIEQDLLAADAVTSVASQARAALDGIDILVNNAGGSRPFPLEVSDEAWEEAMTLNFARPRQLAHAVLAPMIDQGWGRIINITGKSEPEGINGAFSAKAAVHAWAKGLSREVGRYGITVNCVPPGRIMSEQIERHYPPEVRAWQSAHEIPVGAYGEPEDVANLVCFLASPRARYITGAVIPVDGGLRRYQF